MRLFEYSNFNYSDWKRPEHVIVKDPEFRSALYHNGYHVVRSFLETNELKSLDKLFSENHRIDTANGGMFVTIYSKNVSYRQFIDSNIRKLIAPKVESLFKDFKTNGYNFIVKYPGSQSEMFPHQDMPFIDEFEHSEVGVWIPLQNVNRENGCLGILPKSHFSVPPVRSLHGDLPYSNVYDTLSKFMVPLQMNLGDILLYDPRLVHNSFSNISGEPRKAIATRMSPRVAPYIITFKNPEDQSDCFEQIQVEDDFFLNFDDFISNKVRRPEGNLIGKVNLKSTLITEDEFLEFCRLNDLQIQSENVTKADTWNTYSIPEPEHRHQVRSKLSVALRRLIGLDRNHQEDSL